MVFFRVYFLRWFNFELVLKKCLLSTFKTKIKTIVDVKHMGLGGVHSKGRRVSTGRGLDVLFYWMFYFYTQKQPLKYPTLK